MKKVGNPLETPLHVRFSRVQASHTDDYWQLTVEDAKSGILVLEVAIDDHQFSDLMSTRQVSGAPGTLYMSPHYGKQRETKTLYIACPDGYETNMKQLVRTAQVALNKSGEGWVVGDEPRFNSHRYKSEDKSYRLTATRWVDVEG